MNAPLDIIIVEDNFSFALELEMIAKKLGHNIIASVDNSGDALVEILDNKPELVLMDIDIKGKLIGIEIAEKVEHLKIPIIFITSFADDENYDKAVNIDYTSYIIKPINQYTLKSAINLLLKSSHGSLSNSSLDYKMMKGEVYLKKKNDFYRVLIEDIAVIESERIYCITKLADGTSFHNRISLQKYNDYLNAPNFIKPHRSYIININHIQKVNFSENFIIMKDKTNIPISRNIKNELKELLKLIN